MVSEPVGILVAEVEVPARAILFRVDGISQIQTIRGNDEGGGVWEYPSPQQFHNALVRKGMETKEEDVEMMVQIHNFLNERAWDEVVRWEKRHNE